MSRARVEALPTLDPSSCPRGVRALPVLARPRERLAAVGPGALSALELVTLILGAGTRRSPSTEQARKILALAGPSLTGLARLGAEDLSNIDGLGPATAATLVAAIELGRRIAGSTDKQDEPIRGPADVHRRVASALSALGHEEFHVLLLNSQNVPLGLRRVTQGILDASLIHSREVFRHAIVAKAASVILLHNHPSGDPTPSAEDWAVTRQLTAAGETLGIPVVDHIIIAGSRFQSLSVVENETTKEGAWRSRDRVRGVRHGRTVWELDSKPARPM